MLVYIEFPGVAEVPGASLFLLKNKTPCGAFNLTSEAVSALVAVAGSAACLVCFVTH